MRKQNVIKALMVTGVAAFVMAGSASAATITYNTNAPSTAFGAGGLFLNSSLGALATLTYEPNPSSTSGVPSNINYGDFTLTCPSCSTQAQGAGSFFNAFTIHITLTDVTDGATGTFVGSSSGGAVWSDVSTISINWAPLVLGPGAANAATGNFGPTSFSIVSQTLIIAPNSGTPLGFTSLQGSVNSSAVPEPATMAMFGTGLLALGLWRRRKA